MPSHPIPASVQRTDLVEACRPLYELLGIVPENVFSGMVLGNHSVTFTLAAGAIGVDMPEERADSVRVDSASSDHVLKNHEDAELSVQISVAVV